MAALKAGMNRPEAKAKMRARRNILRDDPEYLKTFTQAAHTPEVNARRIEASVAYANTPDGKAAKVRGGNAALKSLKKGAASRKWSYNGHTFRSSWEAGFARFLDGLGTRWTYEPRTYPLEKGTYTPDFEVTLPWGSIIVEIKGPYGKEKFFAFRRAYPDVATMILTAEEMGEILRGGPQPMPGDQP